MSDINRRKRPYYRKRVQSGRSHTRLYPSDFESKLGFETVREQVEALCSNELSQHLASQMQFQTHWESLSQNLALVKEMLALYRCEVNVFPSTYFPPLREALNAIKPEGTYLPLDKCLALRILVDRSQELLLFFEKRRNEEERVEAVEPVNLSEVESIAQKIVPLGSIDKRLKAILNDDGEMKDDASPLLNELRRDIAKLEAGIGKTIQSILAEAQREGWVEKDQGVTIRDGRLVIPVLPYAKRQISGIIHDESASGKTVFLEPQAVVETNNKLREKKSEEKREIVRILKEFTSLVRTSLPDIQGNVKAIGFLDFICAKAKWGLRFNANVPEKIVSQPMLSWKNARHPLLEDHLKKEGKQIVPLNITLDDQDRILVISGPNAGGKSVCLKTVGLLQYLFQCAMPVPLDKESEMGLFGSIFLDIGDQQSLENDLSTYSSHLSNMKFFLQNGRPNSLFLIDEFGSGTEPTIGGAIAESILEQFVENKCYGVITTHYTNIKNYCDSHQGTVNGAMLFDRSKIEPLYALSIGQPGSSFAIEISRKIGLPNAVLDRASSKVGEDFVMQDQYLQDIMRDKKYWLEKREELKKRMKSLEQEKIKWEEKNELIKTKRRELIAEAEREALNIVKSANAKIERTIKDIKENKAEKSTTKASRERLLREKERLEKRNNHQNVKSSQNTLSKELSSSSYSLGESVELLGSKEVGEVLDIYPNKLKVRLGQLAIEVPLNKVRKSLKQAPKVQKTSSSVITESGKESRANFKTQLDIRGMRTAEALEAIAYYVDDAYKINISPVRILHGTGTGALRELVRNYLSTCPIVKSYHDERVDLGGAGITVIEL